MDQSLRTVLSGQQTPTEDKVWLATYHLTGAAQLCYMRLERMEGTPNWRHFTDLVSRLFGSPTRHNPLGELTVLRRTGTMDEFTKRFLMLLARVGRLDNEQQRMLFTASLGEPLKTHVELQKPDDLEAMDLARAYERLATLLRDARGWTPTPRSATFKPAATWPTPLPSSAPPSAPLSAGSVVSTGASGAAHSSTSSTGASRSVRPFKRLTLAEMEERRSQGLCYNCDEKFHPGHQKLCKHIFLLQVEPDSKDEEEPEVAATISLLVLTGIRKTRTMQLAVIINGVHLLALVDSGSTHNFVAAELVARVGLSLTPRTGLQWQSPTATR